MNGGSNIEKSQELSKSRDFKIDYFKKPLDVLESNREVSNLLCLGLRYYEGIFTEKNYYLAYKRFLKAEQKGSTRATLFIANFHLLGLGIKENRKIAIKKYQEIRDEYPEAMYNYGLCHELGLGVKKDLQVAAHCYQLVMKKIVAASYRYAMLYYYYQYNLDEKQDESANIALHCLLSAATAGYGFAYRMLGVLEQERGNIRKSLEYFGRFNQLAPCYIGWPGRLNKYDVSFGERIDKTIGQLEVDLQNDKDNDFTRLLLCSKYQHENQEEKAEEHLAKLADKEFADAAYYYAENMKGSNNIEYEKYYFLAAKNGNNLAYKNYLNSVKATKNTEMLINFFNKELEFGRERMLFHKAWTLFYEIPKTKENLEWSFKIFSYLNNSRKEIFISMHLAYCYCLGYGVEPNNENAFTILKTLQEKFEIINSFCDCNEMLEENKEKALDLAYKSIYDVSTDNLKSFENKELNEYQKEIYNNLNIYIKEFFIKIYINENINNGFHSRKVLKCYNSKDNKNQSDYWNMSRLFFVSGEYNQAANCLLKAEIHNDIREVLLGYFKEMSNVNSRERKIYSNSFSEDVLLRGNIIIFFLNDYRNIANKINIQKIDELVKSSEYEVHKCTYDIVKMFLDEDLDKGLEIADALWQGNGTEMNKDLAIEVYQYLYRMGYIEAGEQIFKYYGVNEKLIEYEAYINLCMHLAKYDNIDALRKLGEIKEKEDIDFSQRCYIRAQLLEQYL